MPVRQLETDVLDRPDVQGLLTLVLVFFIDRQGALLGFEALAASASLTRALALRVSLSERRRRGDHRGSIIRTPTASG